MVNKLALSILVSIILTIIIVSLVNVGIALFMDRPDYNKFCGEVRPSPIIKEEPVVCTEDSKICPDGLTVSRDPSLNCEFPPCSDEFKTCQDEHDKADEAFNQIRFYILALIGFILLLTGLFAKENLVQITGLAAGGILVFEGIVSNWESEAIVFAALLLILIVFGVVAYRVINKKD